MTKKTETKPEKPAYMLAALAKQKVDRMRAGHLRKVALMAVAANELESDYIAALSPEVREIFDALDGAENELDGATFDALDDAE